MQTDKESQTRTENQACFTADVLPLEYSPHSATSTSTVLACIEMWRVYHRVDVYEMRMGSLTDDQIRQPRLCR